MALPDAFEQIRDAISQTSDKDHEVTVMVRSLPKNISQELLLKELDDTGFGGFYDFCFLPRRLMSHLNQGFAFVNFVSASIADTFSRTWNGKSRFIHFCGGRKPVSVALATIQGRKANVDCWLERFANQKDDFQHLPFSLPPIVPEPLNGFQDESLPAGLAVYHPIYETMNAPNAILRSPELVIEGQMMKFFDGVPFPIHDDSTFHMPQCRMVWSL